MNNIRRVNAMSESARANVWRMDASQQQLSGAYQ